MVTNTSSRAALALQRIERIKADLRAGRPVRDGNAALEAIEACLTGLRSFEEAMGLTAEFRKELAHNEIAFAALSLTRGMPTCSNGLLGSARADDCLDKIIDYWNSQWRSDRNRKTRPAGRDGDCWIILIHNQKRVPSITKLRKIRTEYVESALANKFAEFARQKYSEVL